LRGGIMPANSIISPELLKLMRSTRPS